MNVAPGPDASLFVSYVKSMLYLTERGRRTDRTALHVVGILIMFSNFMLTFTVFFI